MKKLCLVCMLLVALSAVASAELLWSEDFESYTNDTETWNDSGTPWVQYHDWSEIDFADQKPAGNGTGMLTSKPRYDGSTDPVTRIAESWLKRGGYDSSQDVTVTAQVTANTNGVDTSMVGWPLANHIFLSNVGIGISDGELSYGILEYGHTGWNTPRTEFIDVLTMPQRTTGSDVDTIAMGITTNADAWYDVKIVAHAIDGLNNDTADLYYKSVGDAEWIEIVTGLDTGHDLDGYVHVHQYNSTSGSAYPRYKAYMDNIELNGTVPEPATMGLLVLGSLFVARRKK